MVGSTISISSFCTTEKFIFVTFAFIWLIVVDPDPEPATSNTACNAYTAYNAYGVTGTSACAACARWRRLGPLSRCNNRAIITNDAIAALLVNSPQEGVRCGQANRLV